MSNEVIGPGGEDNSQGPAANAPALNVEMRVPHRAILLGLVLGGVVGSVANAWGVHPGPPPRLEPWLARVVHYGTEPLGRLFLNLLLMTVVPLVVSSLSAGVTRLGGVGHLGRLGLRTIAYFFLTTTAAVLIGVLLVHWLQPGQVVEETVVQQLRSAYAQSDQERQKVSEFGIQQLVQIVPRNPFQAAAEMNMLGLIVFALLFGVALQKVPHPRRESATTVLDAVSDAMVVIIGLVLRIAPLGVFALIFTTVAQFGFSVLVALGMYVLVVLLGLGMQLLVVFPLLIRFLGRCSPRDFFNRIRLVLLTAFSTSSSNATLPASMRTAQAELGVSPPVAGFVLPLGATMNMNGTALFEGVTVLFLAQVAGVELTLTQQVLVLLLSVLTAVGAAGVPGGSIPLLAMVLAAVQVPPDYLFLILGIDRLLDMCRTVVNVTGDLVAAVYVQRLASSDGLDRGTLR